MPRYDDTFENAMREKGYGVRCLWQIPGIKSTMVEGMECLLIIGDEKPSRIFIVQTMRGGGWEVFAAVSEENSISATIDAADKLMKRSSE